MAHFLAELSEDDIQHLNIGDVLEYKQFNRLQNLSNNNLEKEYENLQADIGRMVELTEHLHIFNCLLLRLKMG